MARDEDADDKELAKAAQELVESAQAEITGCDAFLDWLAIITRAHKSTFHANDRVHAHREGARGVYFKVLKLMELKPEHVRAIGERRIRR